MFKRGDPIWFEIESRIVKGTVTGRFGPCYLAMYAGNVYTVPPHETRQEGDTALDAGYSCKACGDPVDRAIEGELICSGCWRQGEMDQAEAEAERQIAEYMEWAASHCEHCGKPSEGGALHPDCQAERRQIECKLWPVEAVFCAHCEPETPETCEWCGEEV